MEGCDIAAVCADPEGRTADTIWDPAKGAQPFIKGVVAETTRAHIEVSVARGTVVDEAGAALTVDESETGQAGGAEVDGGAGCTVCYRAASALGGAGEEEANHTVDAFALGVAVLAVGHHTPITAGRSCGVEGESSLAAIAGIGPAAAADAIFNVTAEAGGEVCGQGKS